MAQFIAALNTWFAAHPDVSQRVVSLESDVAGPDLSKIRLAKKGITFDALCKLLPAIERLSTRSEARTLLVAYLRDETPPGFKKDVQIQAITDQAHTPDRDAITIARDRWEAQARTDAEFAKMWLTMDGYMHEADAATVDLRVHQALASPTPEPGDIHFTFGPDPTPDLRAAEPPAKYGA